MHETYRLAAAPGDKPSAARSVSLVFSSGTQVVATALREGQSIVVGRSDPAHLVIDDRSLSRTHARFSLIEGRVYVEDLGSTNGTQVDGQLIARAELMRDTAARLGSIEVNLTGTYDARPSPAPARLDLRARLEQELARARYFGRTLALVALRHPSSLAPASVSRFLRPIDVIESYAQNLTFVLLPEASDLEAHKLADSLHRAEPGCHAIGVILYPGPASSPEELIEHAVARARAATPGRGCELLKSSLVADSAQALVLGATMQQLHQLLGRAARTTLPVLVLGETGSGKESTARTLHDASARKAGPYRAVNCAAIPLSLISATLFGHERGAFTGADRQSIGLFEQAHGGTLFLDEIGELPLEAQAAMLRVLETGHITRVGSAKEITVDVRVVAATHRDLSTMVGEGKFREDLLYRLDAFTVRVPPLRERTEDILPLAELFLAQSQRKWSTGARMLSEPVSQALLRYPWPGNVRQLRNVIERAATVASSSVIELDDLPDSVCDTEEPASVADAIVPTCANDVLDASSGSLTERLRRFEYELVLVALRKTHGNQSEAARLLGIPRRTLTNKVHALGLREV